jgi:hypothetical protein
MKKILFLILLTLIFKVYSQSEPVWINNYPRDSRYFTGVGSSNSGNKSQDYEKALVQARLNLAAEISTNIKAETELVTTDSTRGGVSNSYTEQINQSVEQYLKELEIVDTYYSSNQGYWVYLRLNKNLWKEIQDNEMSELLNRIQLLINDDYFSNKRTTSDRLFKLASASTILEESPYSGILKGDIGPFYSGNVFDFMQSEIFKISSDITIELNSRDLSLESGDTADFRITCKSSDNYIGKLPISISKGKVIIADLITDINGNIQVKIESPFFSEGTNSLKIVIDPQKIGFPQNEVYRDNFITGFQEMNILVQSSTLYLTINTNKSEMEFVETPIGSLFTTGNENFKLTQDPTKSRYNLIVTLNFTDYPQVIKNAPLMAGLDCIISLKKENRILFEFKNESLKDGGLSYEQAYRRVFNKLIRNLEENRRFIHEIESKLAQ